MDFYALGLVLLTISTTVGAINFIVTLFKLRAPGMSINRLPIFMWGTLTSSFSILFALPALTVACVMLYLDRRFGTHFFDATAGGHPLLWQHLFWIFGHPWVYIVVLPAMGIVSDALPTFCRRPLVGYTAVALATVTTVILGFGVWVHHMFATGLPPLATVVLQRRQLRHHHPERGRGVRLDRHHLDRTAGRCGRRSCSWRGSSCCSSSAASRAW